MLKMVSFLFELEHRRLRETHGFARHYTHIEIKIEQGEIHTVTLHGDGNNYISLDRKEINHSIQPLITKALNYYQKLEDAERREMVNER